MQAHLPLVVEKSSLSPLTNRVQVGVRGWVWRSICVQ